MTLLQASSRLAAARAAQGRGQLAAGAANNLAPRRRVLLIPQLRELTQIPKYFCALNRTRGLEWAGQANRCLLAGVLCRRVKHN